MKKETQQLILNLKENNEDYEFYPTTDEMLEVIAPHIEWESVLDIGCGTCHFKKFMKAYEKRQWENHLAKQEREKQLLGDKYERSYKSESDFRTISKYYVMEKSKILLEQLDDDTICLGTDFHASTLIDKRVDIIFCNPPYSEFEIWTKKIISEGNYRRAFLVIPQRWKDNVEIQCLLKNFSIEAKVLGSFDFLHAERQARAKVDVVMLTKEKYIDSYGYSKHRGRQEDIEEDAFNIWFDSVFKTSTSKQDKYETDYDISRRSEERKKNKIKDQLVCADRSKASILVELYQNEYNTLINHLK